MNIDISTKYFSLKLGKPNTPSTLNGSKNDFTAKNYTSQDWYDNLMFQPLKGFNLFDSVGSVGRYRGYAYAAISKRAVNLAKADCYIYKEFKSKQTEQKNHPFGKILKSKNAYGQSGKTLFYLTSANLDLYGESFWHVLFMNTAFGRIVTEIRLLPSKYVYPKMNAENTLVESYKYGNVTFSREEIIHFKYPNPDSNVCGIAPVNVFNFTLDIEYLQGRTSRAMFDNNANLEGLITTPNKIGGDNFSKLQEQWKEKYTGTDKSGSTLFLDNGMVYTRTQANPRELDYIQSRTAIRDEIFVILDVPKTVMNVTEDVNYSNSQSALRTFIENTIQPFAEVVIETPINNYFREFYGDRFLFKMEYEFKTDRKLQLETIDLYMRHKIIKKEVIAEQEGYSPEDVDNSENQILENADANTEAA